MIFIANNLNNFRRIGVLVVGGKFASGNYMFKVNNRNTEMCEIYAKYNVTVLLTLNIFLTGFLVLILLTSNR